MQVPADPCVLQCLVYTSRPTGTWTPSTLTAMGDAAGRKNSGLSVTGRLLMVEERFIQVLEGPAGAVSALFAAIREDTRHTDIRTVLDTRVTRRAFEGWAMDLVTEAMMTSAQVARAVKLATAGDGEMILAGMASSFLAKTLRATPVRERAATTMARLLDGAERILLRGGLAGLSIKAVAEEAGVGEKTTYRYFSQPSDMVRMLVRRRQLALFGRFELALRDRRFGSENALASFVVEQTAAGFFSDPRLPRRVVQMLLRDYHDIAYDELWRLAAAIAEVMARDLGAAPDRAQPRLAMALAGIAGMAKMAALHDPATIGDAPSGKVYEMLLLTAMQESRADPR